MSYNEIDQVKFLSVLVTIIILVVIARNWNKPLTCPKQEEDPVVAQMDAAESACYNGQTWSGLKDFKMEMVNGVVQPIFTCNVKGE